MVLRVGQTTPAKSFLFSDQVVEKQRSHIGNISHGEQYILVSEANILGFSECEGFHYQTELCTMHIVRIKRQKEYCRLVPGVAEFQIREGIQISYCLKPVNNHEKFDLGI